jgi:hypothetical protein
MTRLEDIAGQRFDRLDTAADACAASSSKRRGGLNTIVLLPVNQMADRQFMFMLA